MKRLPWTVPLAAVCCAVAVCAFAVEATEPEQDVITQIADLFAELDSDDFSIREVAFERLQELSADEASQGVLAQSVQRAMVDTETSFEVRKRLDRLLRDLPRAELQPVPDIDAGTIDQLLIQLSDDSYARRLGAESRLQWLLGSSESIDVIYERLREEGASTPPTSEKARALRRIYQRARAAWLESLAQKQGPAATAQQINSLVEQVAASETADVFRLTGEPFAVLKLRDLLAIDGNIDPVRSALEMALARSDMAQEAKRRLTELLDLTKPAMVAEYWNSGHHSNIQHLLVGVPSVTPGLGTSHFDRIDDRTAHCVSGVSLSEGDYPVGVAIPHPSNEPQERTAFFHLVNLPTPRRRMAYEYFVKEPEAERFAAIVARTIDRYLAIGEPINERAMVMILQFEPREVSRFAGQYLATVDDRPVEAPPEKVVSAQFEIPVQQESSSIHSQLCSWLTFRGTREAMPGLLRALEQNRIQMPGNGTTYRYDRYAALAIAQRDPWPDVDDWLAKVLSSRSLLLAGQEHGPELGATAAGILLARHGGDVKDFALVPTNDAFARRCGVEAYRYGDNNAAEAVAAWWRGRQAEIQSTVRADEQPREHDG